jgi:hypothetical protein
LTNGAAKHGLNSPIAISRVPGQMSTPAPARAALELRLCRRTLLGATFVKVVSAGGRLYLSGLKPCLTDYLDAEAWLVKGRGG